MEKTVQMSDLISYAVSLLRLKLCYRQFTKKLYGERGFKAVHKTINLVKVAEHSFVGGQR